MQTLFVSFLVALVIRAWVVQGVRLCPECALCLCVECLIDLEPMLRRFDEVSVLEAVLEVKRSKVSPSAK